MSNEWHNSPTAGHKTHGHGQSVIYDKNGKNIAAVYDGESHGEILAASPELLQVLRDCITDNESACLVHDGTKGHNFCLRRIQEINRIAREAIGG